MRIAHVNVWVHNQDEALAFYTGKLGWEVQADVSLPELEGYRWLTVKPPGQDAPAVVLNEVPGPPVMDADSAEQIKTLVGKGWLGGVMLQTDDVRKEFEELKSRGVEFTEEPEERPYGIDSAFRDPSGNSIRLVQPSPDIPGIDP
jgi:catechol 2,3-dioxygenase-like lactoylglutathione lyase family enzyme